MTRGNVPRTNISLRDWAREAKRQLPRTWPMVSRHTRFFHLPPAARNAASRKSAAVPRAWLRAVPAYSRTPLIFRMPSRISAMRRPILTVQSVVPPPVEPQPSAAAPAQYDQPEASGRGPMRMSRTASLAGGSLVAMVARRVTRLLGRDEAPAVAVEFDELSEEAQSPDRCSGSDEKTADEWRGGEEGLESFEPDEDFEVTPKLEQEATVLEAGAADHANRSADRSEDSRYEADVPGGIVAAGRPPHSAPPSSPPPLERSPQHELGAGRLRAAQLEPHPVPSEREQRKRAQESTEMRRSPSLILRLIRTLTGAQQEIGVGAADDAAGSDTREPHDLGSSATRMRREPDLGTTVSREDDAPTASIGPVGLAKSPVEEGSTGPRFAPRSLLHRPAPSPKIGPSSEVLGMRIDRTGESDLEPNHSPRLPHAERGRTTSEGNVDQPLQGREEAPSSSWPDGDIDSSDKLARRHVVSRFPLTLLRLIPRRPARQGVEERSAAIAEEQVFPPEAAPQPATAPEAAGQYTPLSSEQSVAAAMPTGQAHQAESSSPTIYRVLRQVVRRRSRPDVDIREADRVKRGEASETDLMASGFEPPHTPLPTPEAEWATFERDSENASRMERKTLDRRAGWSGGTLQVEPWAPIYRLATRARTGSSDLRTQDGIAPARRRSQDAESKGDGVDVGVAKSHRRVETRGESEEAFALSR